MEFEGCEYCWTTQGFFWCKCWQADMCVLCLPEARAVHIAVTHYYTVLLIPGRTTVLRVTIIQVLQRII